MEQHGAAAGLSRQIHKPKQRLIHIRSFQNSFIFLHLSSEICSNWWVISTAQPQDIFTWNKNEPNSSSIENVVLVVSLVNTRFNTFAFYGFIKHPALHPCRLPACAILASTPPHNAGNDQAAAPIKAEQSKGTMGPLTFFKAAGAVLETALTSRCNSAVAQSVCWSACFLNPANKELHRTVLQCEKFRILSFFQRESIEKLCLRTKIWVH